MCYHVFNQWSIVGDLNHFQFFTILIHGEMDTLVHKPLCICLIISFEKLPRSRSSVSKSMNVFKSPVLECISNSLSGKI